MLHHFGLATIVPKRFRWVGASLLATGMIVGIRATGLLVGLELTTFDLRWRLPPRAQEQRIILVMLQEAGVQRLGQASVSDRVMASLITKVKRQKPRVMGLDFYRNIPLEPGQQELLQVIESSHCS
ncbi:MAG: CHASE2 domain-containing protein [Cyanobacteria bacterium P01_A01_bin.17]